MIILPFFPVLHGRAVLIFPENLAEIAAVAKSADMPNLRHRILPVPEQTAGLLQAAALNIFCGGCMQIVMEQPETLSFT